MSIFLLIIAVYSGIGLFFALWFMARGAAMIDSVAKTTPMRTRAIFLPGAVVVWPLLLTKLIRERGRS